jgi:SPASM domain peptide maturase of grasp-with-spasm system
MKYKEQAHKYIKLFANCFLTRGVVRSLIIDGLRGGYDFIPNDLYDILSSTSDLLIKDLYTTFGEENYEAIDEYLDFLLAREYIFLAEEDDKDLFPALERQWKYPATITNAILDIGPEEAYDIEKALNELDDLQCVALQVRVYQKRSMDFLRHVAQLTQDLTIEQIEIFLPYDEALDLIEMQHLVVQFQKIKGLVLHSAPKSYVIENDYIKKIADIVFLEYKLTDESHCGIVNKEYFSTNIDHYMESQFYNTCLNRKIGVDQFGQIKNCPSHPKSYGHIDRHSLRQALDHPDFKNQWTIKKEQIDVCQVCEFRHICTDCRVYLEDPNNIYSKPAKCSYDPYTASWEN